MEYLTPLLAAIVCIYIPFFTRIVFYLPLFYYVFTNLQGCRGDGISILIPTPYPW